MNARELRQISWQDWKPFRLPLGEAVLQLQHCLRLLPGKRMACQAQIGDATLFAKLAYGPDHHRQVTAEAECLRQLSEAGVRVPSVVDVHALDGMTVLLLEWLPDAKPLDSQPIESWSHQLSGDFCKQIERLFASGFIQEDLHLGNFVVVADAVYVIDAGDMRRHSRVSVRQSRDNLALLCAQAPLPVQETLTALVLANLGAHVDDERRFRSVIHHRLMGRIRHANGKWLRDCTDVHVSVRGSARCFLERRLSNEDRQHVTRLLDEPTDAELIKKGSRISVYRDQRWVVKHYRQASLKMRLKTLFGIHPAQRSWRFGWTWSLLGLATPRPVGLKVDADGSAVLVFPFQVGERYSELLEYQRPRANRLRGELENDLQCMGRAQLWHGDVKAQNILVDGDRASWIDLDAAGWSRQRLVASRKHRREMARFAQNWVQFVDRSDERQEKPVDGPGAHNDQQ